MLGNISRVAQVANSATAGGRHRRAAGQRTAGGGCCGIVGLIMGIVLLFWNEGRSAKRYGMIQEGLKAVVSIENINTIDPANEGKLVHITGVFDTPDDALVDPEFGVDSQGLVMRRTAQMYQWIETVTEYQNGNKTEKSYSYNKGWMAGAISSDKFHDQEGHLNPTSMKFSGKDFMVENVKAGAFVIPDTIKRQLRPYQTVQGISVEKIPDGPASGAKLSGGDTFFYGNDPVYPAVGDNKVFFRYHPLGVTYTIMAKQTGDTFAEYKTKSGGSWFEFRSGSVSAEEIFAGAAANNKMMTTVLRLVGFFILFCGCNGALAPFISLASVVPCCGSALATFLADTIVPFIAFVVSGGIYGLVVGVAWLFYRPLISIPLLVGISGLGFMAFKSYRKNREMEAVATLDESDSDMGPAPYSDDVEMANEPV